MMGLRYVPLEAEDEIPRLLKHWWCSSCGSRTITSEESIVSWHKKIYCHDCRTDYSFVFFGKFT